MEKTLAQIAEIIGGEVAGDADLVITGLSGIQEAQSGDLSFVINAKYQALTLQTQASALIVPRGMSVPDRSVIYSDSPSVAFSQLLDRFSDEKKAPPLQGIHPTAIIPETAKISNNVAIGAYVVIADEVVIEEGSVIQAGCIVGYKSRIGKDCMLYPNVVIREFIEIQDRVVIHSGSVVGSDGFGYEMHNGQHKKIPQIGTVLIEDDVEIGASVTIDRARFDKTIIGAGTKIDNLVQIAHNVVIGKNCIIISQTGISGSTNIEKNVILAGQSGIAGHLTIGEGCVVAAQTGVIKSIPPHTKVIGFPGREHSHYKRTNAYVQRLPKTIELIKDLQKRIEDLEAKNN